MGVMKKDVELVRDFKCVACCKPGEQNICWLFRCIRPSCKKVIIDDEDDKMDLTSDLILPSFMVDKPVGIKSKYCSQNCAFITQRQKLGSLTQSNKIPLKPENFTEEYEFTDAVLSKLDGLRDQPILRKIVGETTAVNVHSIIALERADFKRIDDIHLLTQECIETIRRLEERGTIIENDSVDFNIVYIYLAKKVEKAVNRINAINDLLKLVSPFIIKNSDELNIRKGRVLNICGYDSRIHTDFVNCSDKGEEDDDAGIDINELKDFLDRCKNSSESVHEFALISESLEKLTLASMCGKLGKCSQHDGWALMKLNEVDMEISEEVNIF